MSFQKIPPGTRGSRPPSPNPVFRFLIRAMERYHRFRHDRFMGMDLVYLTTVGAKSGQERRVTVSRFAADDGGWLIVASMGGAIQHPGWYHNIAAHPDQVWAEVGGTKYHVTAEQLDEERRAQAWKQITAVQPRYLGYQKKTDRLIPIIELRPRS
ncbi:nitroreductase/quinone reductase family protein [Nocardia vinacea]|uniref:nitroreductase/quinone reductase family protein n=1 Tax=Nocardia vinacea TaxID=96468 RepID=UPI001FE22390|nr:nitroreductase/quinone reductase family protein [Nocardia vinacea]